MDLKGAISLDFPERYGCTGCPFRIEQLPFSEQRPLGKRTIDLPSLERRLTWKRLILQPAGGRRGKKAG